MSTTISAGLEVRRLCWKDDSFRQADHEPAAGYGTLGWWDNTIGNAITFSNTGSNIPSTGNVLTGGVVTNGAMSLIQSPALSNGDELYLPSNIEVEKDFPVGIPTDIIGYVRIRAKNSGFGTSNLYVVLLDSTLSALPDGTFGPISLDSSLYTHYSIPAFYLDGHYTDGPVWGVRMHCSNGAIVDYVALGSSDYINQGGLSLNVSIPKKTQSQTILNSYDIIQQLGITSRSKTVVIPKAPTTTYAWLKDKLNKSIPLELVTPTQQATGYLSDVKRHSEAGWVGVPLPSSDSLAVTATGQQLYDVSFSLIKADNEVNIDLTCPIVPIPPPPIVLLPVGFPGLKMVTDGIYFYVSTHSYSDSGKIHKIDPLGNVVATFDPSYVGIANNAYNLWYDGLYLYGGYTTDTVSGIPGYIYKLNPSDMSLAASLEVPFGEGCTGLMTIAAGGDVYFGTGAGDLFQFDPTLTVQKNVFWHIGVSSAGQINFDGTYIWWADGIYNGGANITTCVLDTNLNLVAYSTLDLSRTDIAYFGGSIYTGSGNVGQGTRGSIYRLGVSGVNITHSTILQVPNQTDIEGSLTLIGNEVYVATKTNPTTIYIYNYPAWTLAATKHLPDSETQFTAPGTLSLLVYKGAPMILAQDAIYNINSL